MDFALKKLDSGHFDLALEEGDVQNEEGLNTAVQMSLFANSAVGDEGGYWGDFLSDFTEDRLGSRIWGIIRGPNTTDNRQELVTAIQESLSWLVEDSVAGEVRAEVAQVFTNRVDFDIEILNFADERLTAFNFLWDVHRGRAE